MGSQHSQLRPVLFVVAVFLAGVTWSVYSVVRHYRERPYAPKIVATFQEGMTFAESREKIRTGPLNGWKLETDRWSPASAKAVDIGDKTSYVKKALGDPRFLKLDLKELDSFTGEITAYELTVLMGDGEHVSLIFKNGKLVKKDWYLSPG